MKFTFNANIIAQIISGALITVGITIDDQQIQNLTSGLVFVGFLVSSISGLIAHRVNPDGTPSAQPYIKD